MMATKQYTKAGKKHPLLFYRRTVDRLSLAMLTLGVVAGVVGWFDLLEPGAVFGVSSANAMLALAAFSLTVSGLTFLARFLAYVQARQSFLVIATPFLRLKVSYQRVRSVRTALLQQLFPGGKLSWSQRHYLGPYLGETVLVVETRGFPLSRAILRLFLPSAMFDPTTQGLILWVADWMRLSTEIDTLRGAWLEKQGEKRRSHPRGRVVVS